MKNSRGNRLKLNTVSSLLLQITTVLYGFILPRMILSNFGSQVNGLVNSIAQFLGVISLLELGVGAVVQSALYKPLAETNTAQLSRIYVSASKFFKRIGIIFALYVLILTIVYPSYINNNFDFLYTASLIVAISISSIAQYFFGIVNILLLEADQRGYISYLIQIITLLLNIVACIIIIKIDGSIQAVKLITSVVFIARPLLLNWYVKKNYNIDRKISYYQDPIPQKWNGMAQHFANYVLCSTDIIVLTFFSTLANVSVYSVYHLVINGVFMLVSSLSNGFFSYFGDVWARNEKDILNKNFSLFEWLMHMSGVVIFGCTATLIIDFVQVYTAGITDINYIHQEFGLLLVIAYAIRSVRIPYNYIILAAGHYKQTQRSYIIAASLNLIISIITVMRWGLIGVAIGTLVAMVYQSIWQAVYCYKKLMSFRLSRFIVLLLVDVTTFLVCLTVSGLIKIDVETYIMWLVKASICLLFWGITAILLYSISFKEEFVLFKKYIERSAGK